MSQEQNQISDSTLFGSDRMWGLKEIPSPSEIPFVPTTLGWVFLIILAALLLIFWSYLKYKRWKSLEYRRTALKLLNGIKNNPENADQIPFIMRGILLKEGDRETVANLRSSDLTDYMNRLITLDLFSKADAQLFSTLPYSSNRNSGNTPIYSELAAKCITWLGKSNVPV